MATTTTTSFTLRRFASGRKPVTALLLTATAYLLEFAAQAPPAALASPPDRAPGDGAVVIAQISDPHLFEEAKPSRPTWADDEAENQRAFAQALEFLGSRALAGGTLPDALVITGDLGVDSTFERKRAEAGRPLDRARQAAAVANLLRMSPVKRVFVVAGNNDVANERSDPAELRHFHAFVASVADSLKGSGVALRDLTACYADAAASDRACYQDLRGGVRLVGFASATFKNAPPLAPGEDKLLQYARSRRTVVADQTRALDSAFVRRLGSLVSGAARAGKRAVILTHEPDLDDPFAVDTLRARQGSYPDPQDTYDPAVWNVGSGIRESWVRAANDDAVAAVLAGHFHSARRPDYDRPYLFSSAAGRARAERLFVSPPLAIKNQGGQVPGARGISLYRIAGRDVQREVAWYQAGTGFSAAQPERAGAAAAPAAVRPARPSTRDRMGIVVFAILSASGAVLLGLKEALREARKYPQIPFSWREDFGYAWAVVWGLGGLVVTLLLYSNSWSDRGEVALWYAGTFAIWAAASALALRFTR